ncbi:hypothetical protein [Nocardia sp. BMG51109]|uniref:hypothetical protein n=1 Tax=Nocardia sp. BMG51109 TaxID=1056816 RepID=UPI0004B0DB93|nr:hypothetical protein [Nocardia sp. BMG51109]
MSHDVNRLGGPRHRNAALRSELTPTTSRGRLTDLLRSAVAEIDGLVIFVSAAGIAMAALLKKEAAFQIPALVAISVAVGIRVFRIKYQANDIADAVVAESRLTHQRLDAVETALRSNNLHEAEICDRTGFYRHMLSALRATSRSADLTQLDSQPPQHYGTPEMVEYFDTQTALARANTGIKFRRIVAIPTLEKLEWVVSFLDQVRYCTNFQVGVVDLVETEKLPPPLSLQIFDRQEICLVDPTFGYMLPEDQRHMLWMKGNAAAEVFSTYYDTLWYSSSRLKEGNIIHWDELEKRAQELTTRFPEKKSYGKNIQAKIKRLSGKAK